MRSPVPTTPERYAVVSCHVERPLDERVWAAFAELQRRPPGGVPIAALMRPPDPSAGETDSDLWLERAASAAARGPVGHHAHWTSPTHARPTEGDAGGRVRADGAWLVERGVRPTLFCGGGWYTDPGVAAACAELGYVDCTPRPVRPSYLSETAAWAELSDPARLTLPRGRELVAVPTTHGLGDLVRALALPGRLPDRVHTYFHDTDLVDPRRRRLIAGALALLARRRPVTDLDAVAASVTTRIPWDTVARGEAAAPAA